jgi:hypothetical protein
MITNVRLSNNTEDKQIPVCSIFHAQLVCMDKNILADALPAMGWMRDEYLTMNNGMGYTVYMRSTHEGTYRAWVK